MVLIIENSKVYLFNSSPMYADAVRLRDTLRRTMPKLGLVYGGTVFYRCGFWYRRQLQVQDTCSVWVALAYHILASHPDAPWEALKSFLGKTGKEQRRILHEFHRTELGAKPFSFDLDGNSQS